MRILVMGAGAIGSVFGGFLARAGHDVSLVGRPQHMAAVAQKGLEIGGLWGEHHIGNLRPFTSVEQLPPGPFELILITTKSYDTREAAQQARGQAGPESLALSLQNGLGNLEVLTELFGAHRAVGGRVIFGAHLVRPGRVEVTVYADKVLLGSATGQVEKARLERVAQAFSQAGIPTEAVADIEKYLWGKVLYNCCLNALSALLDCTYGDLAERPETRQIMREVIAEAFAVAKRQGIALLWASLEEYEALFFGRLIPPTASHYASMLQDVKQGKRTEIEALNGAIARLAQEVGVDAPVNRLLTALIKAREQRGAILPTPPSLTAIPPGAARGAHELG